MMSQIKKFKVLLEAGIEEGRNTYIRRLEESGFEVTCVTNMAEALSLLQCRSFHFIIYDFVGFSLKSFVTFNHDFMRNPALMDTKRVFITPLISDQIQGICAESAVDLVLDNADATYRLGLRVKKIAKMPEYESEIDLIYQKIKESFVAKNEQKSDEKLIHFLQQSHQKFPSDVKIRLALAQAFLKKGSLADARVLAEKVLLLNDKDSQAMHIIACVHIQNGMFNEARRLLNIANMMSPFNPERLSLMEKVQGPKPTSLAHQPKQYTPGEETPIIPYKVVVVI